MHPELEDFLNDAFQEVKPSAAPSGRVVVEPDYDVAPDMEDAAKLALELQSCLANPPKRGEVSMSGDYTVLRKYLRRIMLHPDPADGAWVEVEPPGNWI